MAPMLTICVVASPVAGWMYSGSSPCSRTSSSSAWIIAPAQALKP